MNRNVVIVLAGGFLIAVLVAVLVQASLTGSKSEPAPVAVKEEPKVQIIVAAQDLKVGAKLDGGSVKWQSWPEKAVFPGAIVRQDEQAIEDAVSGSLNRAMKEGEPIVESAIVDADGPLMSATLAEGMRAVSFPVSSTTMVSGFVGPGDYVDIMLTYSENLDIEGVDNPAVEAMISRSFDRMAVETIMENVKILAVDTMTARSEDSKDRHKVGKNVTVEVDQKGAETIALASKLGDLSLSLRRLGDDTISKEQRPITTDARIRNIDDELYREVNKMQDNSGLNDKIVRIYRGEAVENVSVSP